MTTIKECVEQVKMSNEIAGNFNLVTQESLVAQAKVVEEEGKELLEAALDGNPNEILKECVDVLVTIHGFVAMLEEQGYNVMDAWRDVNTNNLSKFPTSEKVAYDSVIALSDEGVFCNVEENSQYQVYVIKNEAGKVMKPIGYKKANVSFFTPKGIMPKVKIPEQAEVF